MPSPEARGSTSIAGRRHELEEIGWLLDRALRGVGGMLAISGPPGSGKTLLAESAAAQARVLGLEVLWSRASDGTQGRLAWAQLLHDAGAPAAMLEALLNPGTGPLDLDSAARYLVSGAPRLVIIDDVDRGGPEAIEMLAVVAARCPAAPAAVIATAVSPLRLGSELRLGALSQDALAAALGLADPETCHALWLASAGRPGAARQLALELASFPEPGDPVVRLALMASSTEPFLVVDTNLVRLLEEAAGRARDDVTRGRVLARLAHELLGDASAATRRRALADEALSLARRCGDAGMLADVLDARLHALWDPVGAEDRLAAGSEIIDLARAAGDGKRERHGMFWRFVALMELGRVAEAESALAAYDHEAATAGDAGAQVMAMSRHGMLAVLRGRFGQATEIAEDVEREAARIALPDAEAVTSLLRGSVALEQGLDDEEWQRLPEMLLASARQRPGHLIEADAARVLVALHRVEEGAAEMQRVLPRALGSSGPRWLCAMAHLAVVAAAAGDASAARQVYEAMVPYRGRLVVSGGAVSSWGLVSHHLGVLATAMGRDDAGAYFEEAIEWEERTGALPFLAHSLAGHSDALAAQGEAGRAADCRARAREIARRLGMTVLLNRLGEAASQWSLVRDGDDWLLSAGGEHARLRDSRGMHYLRALLAAPGQDVRALDLAAGGAGLVPAQAGPVLDNAARQAYRRRLATVTAQLDAADRAGDRQAADRAEAEKSALVRELRAATGLGGRARMSAPEAERARVNVTRTLRTAIGKIAGPAPIAAAHLRASIRTGGTCRYDPAPGGPDHWLA